jgi:23S rRNA G2445 N2-methylase RlmL
MISTQLLAGCGTAPLEHARIATPIPSGDSSGRPGCPHLTVVDKQRMQEIADAVQKSSKKTDDPIAFLLIDWLRYRDEIRACRY